jgi:hypothetical protein
VAPGADRVGALTLPDGASRLVTRNGVGEIAVGETMIMPGDQVIAIPEARARKGPLRRARLVG